MQCCGSRKRPARSDTDQRRNGGASNGSTPALRLFTTTISRSHSRSFKFWSSPHEAQRIAARSHGGGRMKSRGWVIKNGIGGYKSAKFSECGRYRYTLSRSFNPGMLMPRHVNFIMLNPSAPWKRLAPPDSPCCTSRCGSRRLPSCRCSSLLTAC